MARDEERLKVKDDIEVEKCEESTRKK